MQMQNLKKMTFMLTLQTLKYQSVFFFTDRIKQGSQSDVILSSLALLGVVVLRWECGPVIHLCFQVIRHESVRKQRG